MTAEAFKRQFEALSAEYRSGLPRKFAELDGLWRDLAGGTAAPDRLADLQRELHTLAGTARTLGVAGVSEAAAAAESFLEPYGKRRKLPPSARHAEFQRLLEALKQAAR